MRIARALFLPLVLLGAACGDGAGDIEPRDGAWSYMGSAAVDDTCMLDELTVDMPGTFTITNNGDGTFTVNDTQNMFDCTIDGSSFSCPSRLAGENDIGAQFSLDAVVRYNVSASGSFESETQMSGRQTVVVNCDGADCASFEALVMVTTPCGWAQDFTASAK
ncbi:hypothetical protein DB30_03144 [Enhygromyxa salina]|uniref:Lipoprotein n=1 Tax=Enhygromyxa salina TaxID=215803 RepID=A0A0C2A217_9BACT|nr:hypothetical protein [Enhygromyxa salina]KIG17443.1 hypothetical protein DB30_03144 [Enhygromyxa salina]